MESLGPKPKLAHPGWCSNTEYLTWNRLKKSDLRSDFYKQMHNEYIAEGVKRIHTASAEEVELMGIEEKMSDVEFAARMVELGVLNTECDSESMYMPSNVHIIQLDEEQLHEEEEYDEETD